MKGKGYYMVVSQWVDLQGNVFLGESLVTFSQKQAFQTYQCFTRSFKEMLQKGGIANYVVRIDQMTDGGDFYGILMCATPQSGEGVVL